MSQSEGKRKPEPDLRFSSSMILNGSVIIFRAIAIIHFPFLYSHSVDFVKNETNCFILIFNTLTRFSIYLIILVVSKSGVKLYWAVPFVDETTYDYSAKVSKLFDTTKETVKFVNPVAGFSLF